MTQRTLRPGERIRVLVVDDSVVIRRLVSHALEEAPELEVVGAASNGAIALQRIPFLNPDVVTLDIEMPEMDGLETLRRIRREHPHLRVIMFSTLTERGAAITLTALSLGADDYVSKAANGGSLDQSLARLRQELVPKIRQFFKVASPAKVEVARPAVAPKSFPRPARVLGIGISTGGPAALAAILPTLPKDFPLPVLVVQHMPPVFTRLLAERLNATCRIPAVEAAQGDPVIPGKIFIAPGDFHMKVASAGAAVRICLDQSPPLNSCRPAVDALFASIADVYGGAANAMIMTGMGQDGMLGARALKALGARILVQDEESSVVWGMPGAVVNAGLADCVLPLDKLVAEVL